MQEKETKGDAEPRMANAAIVAETKIHAQMAELPC